MKRIHSVILSSVLLLFVTGSCHTTYKSTSVHFTDYRIQNGSKIDSGLNAMIVPYGNEVNKSMNEVLGVAPVSMEKKQPECDLGNYMVDAFFIMAKEKYAVQIDGAVFNYGGIRLTQLPAGNVTRGKIFELMPFDNLLLIQKIKGDVLQLFLDHTAAGGGWPLAGITMQIKDKKAVNVLIGGKPLDPAATYTIANSDFLANGGDNADMLRAVPRETNGYLMRDALLDYTTRLKSQGKAVTANIENRVTNAQ